MVWPGSDKHGSLLHACAGRLLCCGLNSSGGKPQHSSSNVDRVVVVREFHACGDRRVLWVVRETAVGSQWVPTALCTPLRVLPLVGHS